MRKFMALFLTLALMVCSLAGCGSESKEEKPVLKVATIEGTYAQAVWQQVCEAFTEQTGIAVELTFSKTLNDKLLSGEKFDVVHLGTYAEATKKYAAENKLSDLSSVLAMTVPGENVTVESKLLEGLANAAALSAGGNSGACLLPTFYQPCGLFYNADLFTQKRWEIPTTWDEMWMLAETALDAGIYLFTYAEEADLENFIYALAHNVGGQTFFDALTNFEEGLWDTSEGRSFLRVLTKLAQYTYPSTPAHANEQDKLLNQRAVMENKALFLPDGTWITAELVMEEASITTAFGWGMISVPAVKEGQVRYGHADPDYLWIPLDASMKAEAEQFAAFMYSDVATSLFAGKGAFLPVRGMSEGLTGINKEFYGMFDNGCKLSIGGFAEHAPVDGLTTRSIFCNGFSKLVAGEITANQFMENVKTGTDQLRANMGK